MALRLTVLALAAANAVTAHFGLEYPEWRADTLSEDPKSTLSQYDFPCGGAPYKAGNITNWPLTGGALKLDLHHPWTYVFVNLGLGDNTTNFNVSLTPEFLNVTGKGELCIPKLALPLSGVAEGTLASLQVVTVGASGSALYNCADIRLTKNATGPSNCSTAAGMVVQPIKQQNGNGSDSSSGGDAKSGNATTTSPPKPNAAAGLLGSDKIMLTTTLGLAVALALGLGL